MCDWGSTIRNDLPETIRRSSEIGGAAVIWDWHDVTAELVAQAHAAGLAVYAADCPTTAEAVREARTRGIDILEADIMWRRWRRLSRQVWRLKSAISNKARAARDP